MAAHGLSGYLAGAPRTRGCRCDVAPVGLGRVYQRSILRCLCGCLTRRQDPQLELWGHVRARSVASLAWLCTLIVAFASLGLIRLRPYRSLLWSLTAAMVLGPLTVVVLKSTTSYPCPWDLQRFGGSAQEPTTALFASCRAPISSATPFGQPPSAGSSLRWCSL